LSLQYNDHLIHHVQYHQYNQHVVYANHRDMSLNMVTIHLTSIEDMQHDDTLWLIFALDDHNETCQLYAIDCRYIQLYDVVHRHHM
jgi:hypothetical protein